MSTQTDILNNGETWVVVAGSERADIYRRHEQQAPLKAVQRLTDEQAPAEQQSLTGFAQRIAAFLHKAQQNGSFERLVIVAGQAMLDELHKQLDDETSARITAEFSKELPASTPEEVSKLLAA